MQVRICTSCGEQNPENTWECVNCGETLSVKTLTALNNGAVENPDHETAAQSEKPLKRTSPNKKNVLKTSEYSASSWSSKRYKALSGISSLCTGLSRLMLGLAGLGIFGGLQVIVSQSLPTIFGFLIIIVSIIGGAATYIFFRVLAEGISVFLDIESNTRATAMNVQDMANSLEQLVNNT